MEEKETFFDFAAEAGLTKHFGGAGATEELAELCHVGPGSYVLDVGCGVGTTPAFLAKKYGCRVMGVEIRARMIERAQDRVQREGVAGQVEFRLANAQDLPFDDNVFDAVITESVTAIVEDQAKAISEYVRVTRPGGYVGLAEATWLKVPYPPELVEWASQASGAAVEPQTSDGWVASLERAGLSEVVARVRQVNPATEVKELVQRYGVGGMLRSQLRALALYLRSPAYRAFVKSVRQKGVIPQNLTEYFGYGMYVGKKPLGAKESVKSKE